MSRTITTTLQAAQDSGSRTPYFHMIFTSKDGLTTYDFSTDSATYPDRILLIDHTEEPYNDYAYIILRNNDRTIPDLKGFWVEIGYGDTTLLPGNEYEGTPRLWVKAQRLVSAQKGIHTSSGNLYTLLELEGVWGLFKEQPFRLGTPDFTVSDWGKFTDMEYVDGEWVPKDTTAGYTIYDLIDYIVSQVAIATGQSLALGSLVTSDGIVDVFTPNMEWGNTQFESAGSILQALMAMTKSYIRYIKIGSIVVLYIVYPQDSDPVDETYYSYQAPYFYEYQNQDPVVIPNHVIVFCNQEEDGTWIPDNMFVGIALDQEAIDQYMDVTHPDIAAKIDNQADADTRAEAILSKIDGQLVRGTLTVPHDARVELYDKVEVNDTRGM